MPAPCVPAVSGTGVVDLDRSPCLQSGCRGPCDQMSAVAPRNIPTHVHAVRSHCHIGIIETGSGLAKNIRREIPVGPGGALAGYDGCWARYRNAVSVPLQKPDEAIDLRHVLHDLVAAESNRVGGKDHGRVQLLESAATIRRIGREPVRRDKYHTATAGPARLCC